MKIEERQIKATFLAGICEWILRFFCQFVLHYNPPWVQIMGALGTGMILYAIIHGRYYRKETQGGKNNG